ncbi:hypothetical protein D3C86_1578520 [compost metagenome]
MLTGLRADAKTLAVMFNRAHRTLFMHLRAMPPCSLGERRRHQPRVGVPVIRTVRSAYGHVADPWKSRAQLLSVKHLQIKAETLATGGVVLQRS